MLTGTMSDDSRLRSLLEGNERFYRVFEKLDYEAMEALWERSDRIFCVHPGWSPLYGEKAVMDSWKRIIENTASMHFDLLNVQGRDGTICSTRHLIRLPPPSTRPACNG